MGDGDDEYICMGNPEIASPTQKGDAISSGWGI